MKNACVPLFLVKVLIELSRIEMKYITITSDVAGVVLIELSRIEIFQSRFFLTQSIKY